jgi:hypothetical protein
VIANFLEFVKLNVHLAKERLPLFTRPQSVAPGPTKQKPRAKGQQPPAEIKEGFDLDLMHVDNDNEAESDYKVSKADENSQNLTKLLLVESPIRERSVAKRIRSTGAVTGQAVEELFDLSHLHVHEDSAIDLKEFPEPAGLVHDFFFPGIVLRYSLVL